MMRIEIISELNSEQKLDWINLFILSFKSTKDVALNIYRKYELNQSYFCLIYQGSKLAASYSGICVKSTNGLKMFISTDTMSMGIIRGASNIAAENLYEFLKNKNFHCVCGFPNKKIYDIRIKKLNWRYMTQLDAYIQFLPDIMINYQKSKSPYYEINRPAEGFYRGKIFGIHLKNYIRSLSFFCIVMSSKPLGFGFLNVSKFIPMSRKYFCYKILDESKESQLQQLLLDLHLNENSIDVP